MSAQQPKFMSPSAHLKRALVKLLLAIARELLVAIRISRDSPNSDVKKAYKKVALKLHPDKNKAPGAEDAFKKLSKAYQCLTNEDSKQMYDRYGDEERMPQQQRQQYQQDFMTPEDLFSAFFGGGSSNFH